MKKPVEGFADPQAGCNGGRSTTAANSAGD